VFYNLYLFYRVFLPREGFFPSLCAVFVYQILREIKPCPGNLLTAWPI